MFADFRETWDVITGIFTICILLGGIVIFFRGAYNKARIDALRQDITDYKERTARQEEEKMQDRARIERLEQQVEHMEKENALLRGMVTQRAQVEELAIILGDHHQESLKAWEAITEEIRNAFAPRA